MTAVNRWILGARPRTLPAAVVPVAIGAGAAVGGPSPVWWRVGPALIVSLALQIGVNYSNDYSDGIRGTDDVRVGPVRLVAGGLAPPAHVKRAVWERDRGQCTFIGETGRRCSARSLLEFDHIDEVARGGEATTDRMRLRCRGHNQFTAEQTFGAEFMERKREESRHAGRAARASGSGESAAAHSHIRR